jgi:hypothetical protein
MCPFKPISLTLNRVALCACTTLPAAGQPEPAEMA